MNSAAIWRRTERLEKLIDLTFFFESGREHCEDPNVSRIFALFGAGFFLEHAEAHNTVQAADLCVDGLELFNLIQNQDLMKFRNLKRIRKKFE